MPSDAVDLLDDILELRGWERRDGQVQMVAGIHDAVVAAPVGANVDVAVNAPVGTGKSLAGLLPGIALGERIIIATSTKSLQDQYVFEELPQLRDDLRKLYGYELTFSVLKGKSNYPCAGSVRAALNHGVVDDDDSDMFEGVEIQTTGGDVDVIGDILKRLDDAQDAGDVLSYDAEHLISKLSFGARKSLTASKSCPGKSGSWLPKGEESEDFANIDMLTESDWAERRQLVQDVVDTPSCVYRAAYASCMNAQIVVLNTSLLVYEILKARSKFSPTTPTLLNGVGVVIIDEAHHLPRILASAYAARVDFEVVLKQTEDLINKLGKRYDSGVLGQFALLADQAYAAEGIINSIIDDPSLKEAQLRDQLSENLGKLATMIGIEMRDLQERIAASERESPSGKGKLGPTGIPKVLSAQFSEYYEHVTKPLTEAAASVAKRNGRDELVNKLTFSSASRMRLSIDIVPVDVSFFRMQLSEVMREPNIFVPPIPGPPRSIVVMGSGTITEETPRLVGLRPSSFIDVPTPFDSKRARMCVPMLPEPNDPAWWEAAWDVTKRAIEATDGRTMILTTSRAKLEQFTERARAELSYNVFSQLDPLTKSQLVRATKDDEKSILVGTTSFWEGVDVPGPAVSLVVMDKAPFPSKDDPIFAARRQWVTDHGGSAFNRVDVDYAAVMIAQGAGRLIRSVKDIGGVMLLDPRYNVKKYGPELLKLLPADWPITTSVEDFLDWQHWVVNRTNEVVPRPGENWRPIRQKKIQRKSLTNGKKAQ